MSYEIEKDVREEHGRVKIYISKIKRNTEQEGSRNRELEENEQESGIKRKTGIRESMS